MAKNLQLFNQNWLIVPRQQFQDQLSDLVLISWLWVDDANGFGQLYLPIAKKMYTGLVFLKLIKQTGGKTNSVLIVHSFFGFPFVMVQPNWQFSERWKMRKVQKKRTRKEIVILTCSYSATFRVPHMERQKWRGEKRSFAFLTPPPISTLISNF